MVCRNHRLHGSNTDWLGAVRALEDRTALDGRRAIVLGAGGTARAVAYGLRERGAGVTILNRTEARARSLAKDLGVEAGGPLTALADTPHEVLVNTTSIGLDSDDTPVECEWIAAGATVMDAVYSPERTRLLREADARGATTISGKWMLIHQAVAQLQAWAGNDWNSARNAQVTKAMAHAFDEAGRAG